MDTVKFSSGDKNIMQQEIMKLVRNRAMVSRRMKTLLADLIGGGYGDPDLKIPRKREAQWEMLWPMLKKLSERQVREWPPNEGEWTEPGWGC